MEDSTQTFESKAQLEKVAVFSNLLPWAIVSTILCCQPLGIVSIVFAVKLNEQVRIGNIEEAEKNYKKAKLWLILAIVLGGISYVLYILFWVALGLLQRCNDL